MAVQPIQYTREEIADLGDEIYASKVRSQVESGNHGRVVAIDVESGAFDLGDNSIKASDALLLRYPKAQIWFVRIGYLAVHRIGHSGVTTAQ
jgi:hypothetical protein